MNSIERSLSPSEPDLPLPISSEAPASINKVIEQIAVVTDDVGEQDTIINEDVLNNDAGAMP